MTTGLYITAAVVAVAVIWLVVRPTARFYRKFRGTRVVECPENHQPAAVEVDTSAALQSAFGTPKLELRECSRWPERAGCGQECLAQVETSPEDCLVRNMLTRWYADKTCVVCLRPLEPIDWYSHKPALLSPDNKSREWSDIAPETLPHVLATHKPLCWNCHVAMTFHSEHDDRVVDRPWKKEDYYPTG